LEISIQQATKYLTRGSTVKKDGQREKDIQKTSGTVILLKAEGSSSDSVKCPLVVVLLKVGDSWIFTHFSSN
jgi:hypothetical protein